MLFATTFTAYPTSDGPQESSQEFIRLTPQAREERDVSTSAVREALLDIIKHGSLEAKIINGCRLPDLAFDYESLDGDTNHPVLSS